MSKKIFAALIVAVVATFAGYNIYQSQRAESFMSDLAMANVEALARDEANKKEISMNNRMEKRNDLHRLVTTDSQITQRKKKSIDVI